MAHDEIEHEAGDDHVGGDGNAVSSGQVGGSTEHDHHNRNGDEQRPVHERQINLTGFPFVGVQDLQTRQIAQLDDLLGGAVGAGNECLRSNDRSRCCQGDHRVERPFGHHHEEGVDGCFWLAQQQGALPQITQHQRRHHHQKPGHLNRPTAKMTHIGIKGLSSGHAQNNRTQNEESDKWLPGNELQSMQWIQCQQNIGAIDDLRHTQRADGDEPQQHDWAEKPADSGCAFFLEQKQRQQNSQREGNQVMLEGFGGDFQAFHRRQHGNGWRDHPVAIKQAGTGNAQKQEHGAQFGIAAVHDTRNQCQHRHQSAFAVVVGAQDQQDVFE